VAIHKGLVIAPDLAGNVHCLDAKTGEQYWAHNVKDFITGSPLVVDDKIYVVTESGDTWILKLAKEKVVVDRVKSCSGKCSPVFANGVLYVVTYDTLFAIAGDEKKPAK
jgi:outer membrane protein assembly factor BamB